MVCEHIIDTRDCEFKDGKKGTISWCVKKDCNWTQRDMKGRRNTSGR